MIRRLMEAVFVLSLLSVPATADDWQTIFNGSDLTGWRPMGGSGDNWSAADGVLACNGKPGAQWLATEDEYADFELSLEFNVPENGNSGVFVRAPSDGVPYVDGIEIQVLDDYGDKWEGLQPDQYTGSIYAVAAPSKRVTKQAGQWQSMFVRCWQRRLQVKINGHPVLDANLDDFEEQTKKVPGLKRQSGHIGLQNHGDKISFRNIRVRKLESKK